MKGYLSVCAIYKNEARYLAEWIEFHLLAGVEHFFLYDNNSTDDHREVLAPYVRAGVVTVTDWPQFPPQVARVQPLPRGEPARLALDGVHRPGRVPVLAPHGAGTARCCAEYEQLPGVGALWIIFGTSGHKTPPPGLVLENYTWRRIWPRRPREWKSIVDPRRTRRARGAHMFRYTDPGVRRPGARVRLARRPAPEPLHHEVRAGAEGEARARQRRSPAEGAGAGASRRCCEPTGMRRGDDPSLRAAPCGRRSMRAGISTEDGRPASRTCVTHRTHAARRAGTVRSRSKREEESMGELPPGPRAPSLFQTMGWWMRPISFLERNRARYGKRFTIRLLGERVFVMLSDPADVKQVYTSPPDVLHPGEGARILAPGRRPELRDPARRRRPPRAAQADAAGLPRREDAGTLRPDARGRRARGGAVAARRAGGPASAAAGTDPRGDPPGGVRARPRPAPRRAARAPDADPRDGQHSDRDAAVPAAGPRRARAVGQVRAPAGGVRRADLRVDRGAPPRGRRAQRRAVDAARRAPRGRLADERPGGARRADDAPGRRSRDDGLRAGLGVRAPHPLARRAGAPGGRDRLRATATST